MAMYMTPETVLRTYLHAKDENRPHLLDHVFDAEAELLILNQASTIAFPARTLGREAIADVLVRQFGQSYENVYSFYLHEPPAVGATDYSCPWLVAMSEKQGRAVRVGCGRYDWTFAAGTAPLATRLQITIHAMQVLPPTDFNSVITWIGGLNYPWCPIDEVLTPEVPELTPVLQYLSKPN